MPASVENPVLRALFEERRSLKEVRLMIADASSAPPEPKKVVHALSTTTPNNTTPDVDVSGLVNLNEAETARLGNLIIVGLYLGLHQDLLVQILSEPAFSQVNRPCPVTGGTCLHVAAALGRKDVAYAILERYDLLTLQLRDRRGKTAADVCDKNDKTAGLKIWEKIVNHPGWQLVDHAGVAEVVGKMNKKMMKAKAARMPSTRRSCHGVLSMSKMKMLTIFTKKQRGVRAFGCCKTHRTTDHQKCKMLTNKADKRAILGAVPLHKEQDAGSWPLDSQQKLSSAASPASFPSAFPPVRPAKETSEDNLSDTSQATLLNDGCLQEQNQRRSSTHNSHKIKKKATTTQEDLVADRRHLSNFLLMQKVLDVAEKGLSDDSSGSARKNMKHGKKKNESSPIARLEVAEKMMEKQAGRNHGGKERGPNTFRNQIMADELADELRSLSSLTTREKVQEEFPLDTHPVARAERIAKVRASLSPMMQLRLGLQPDGTSSEEHEAKLESLQLPNMNATSPRGNRGRKTSSSKSSGGSSSTFPEGWVRDTLERQAYARQNQNKALSMLLGLNVATMDEQDSHSSESEKKASKYWAPVEAEARRFGLKIE
eukprot:g14242.t1